MKKYDECTMCKCYYHSSIVGDICFNFGKCPYGHDNHTTVMPPCEHRHSNGIECFCDRIEQYQDYINNTIKEPKSERAMGDIELRIQEVENHDSVYVVSNNDCMSFVCTREALLNELENAFDVLPYDEVLTIRRLNMRHSTGGNK